MDDGERDDAEVRASVDSFRRARSAASDGFRMLREGIRTWAERRHPVVQFGFAITFWFAGNWVYNQIAPTVFTVARAVVEQVLFRTPTNVVALLESNLVLLSVQFLTVLIGIVVGQNRIQTQKLKDVESKLTTMSKKTVEATDGGTRELPPIGGRAIGGLIAGGAIGLSFGPGGVFAGMFLGFVWGDKLDIRAYRRNPHTPDLNRESKAEQ